MTFQTERDNLDGVAEPVKKLYRQDETTKKFVFDPESAVNSVVSILANRNELLEEKRKFKDLSTVLGEHNLDAPTLKEILDKRKTDEAEGLRKKGDFDAMLKSVNTEWEGKMGKLTAREKSLMAVIEDLLVTAEASKILGQDDTKGSLDLLLPQIAKRAKPVEENGRFRVQVIDPETGTERFVGGAGMSLKALIQELKTIPGLAGAFEGNGATGSGAPAGGGGSGRVVNGVPQVASRADLKTDSQKSAYIDAYGLDAFKALPSKA